MTAKSRSDAQEVSDTVTSFVSMLQGPAASTLVASQRLALEAARFWARRLHAYADQMEALAACATPNDLAHAQTRFIERMRDDYAEEGRALGALLTPMTLPGGRRGNGEHASSGH